MAATVPVGRALTESAGAAAPAELVQCQPATVTGSWSSVCHGSGMPSPYCR